jgi:hypothetical protein
MKNILNKRLLGWMPLLITLMFVSSCKKDEQANSGMVELLSFGPTGIKHGEELRFIGNNLNKVTAIEFVGATVEKTAFVEQTSEIIRLIVPESTAEGLVTLKVPEGDIISKTIINFNVPVVISAFTPEARPGDNITVTGEYLNWVKEIKFAKDIIVTQFVSQTLNELVVAVPQEAESGILVFSTGGTEPLIIETDTELKVTLPAISSFSPNPIERKADLTITGTNLDLVEGVLFKGLTSPITNFVSQTATKIVLTVPEDANKGKISVVAHSGIAVESAASLEFIGDLPSLAPLGYAMYIDGFENGWQDWGWSRTADYTNGDNVRDGAASMKVDYTGQWGAMKFANGNVSTASYNEITFSVFGTPGTGGKKIMVSANGGPQYLVTIVEGEWTEYKLTKADLGSPATISDLAFQIQDWTGVVYFDHVGLR